MPMVDNIAIAIAIAIDLKPAVILPIKDAGGGYQDPGGLVDKFHRFPNLHLKLKPSQNQSQKKQKISG